MLQALDPCVAALDLLLRWCVLRLADGNTQTLVSVTGMLKVGGGDVSAVKLLTHAVGEHKGVASWCACAAASVCAVLCCAGAV